MPLIKVAGPETPHRLARLLIWELANETKCYMMLLGFAGLGFAFRQSRHKVSFA